MTHTTRRHFLQFAGSTLAAIGFNQLSFLQSAQRHAQVLAQSTPRKLALLVGINNYTSQPLEGCLNDVDLQRNLLIYRFGFNPKDIYVLPDAKATRQGILTAFEEHLIKQAKPGDVVVYHYSGHGSRIFDPNPIVVEPGEKGLNGTFVPVDSNLPAGYPDEGGTVQDIMPGFLTKLGKKGVKNCQNIDWISIPAVQAHDPDINRLYPRTVPI